MGGQVTNTEALGIQAAAFLGVIETLQRQIAELQARLEAKEAEE